MVKQTVIHPYHEIILRNTKGPINTHTLGWTSWHYTEKGQSPKSPLKHLEVKEEIIEKLRKNTV